MKFRHLQKLIMPPPERETGIITLHGEDIAFTIVRSKRRKRTLAFTIDAGASLRIMAPMRTRLPVIRSMLQHRSNWILQKITEHKKMRELAQPKHFANDESVLYLGHAYRLRVTQNNKIPQGCKLKPHCLEVNITDAALSEENLRQEVRLEILLWMKKRAKIKFKKRMDLWADKLGVKYRKLLITDPARQWGSCTVDNVVRLNWRLMMAPLKIIDYVAAHELAHVAHKNHSPHFWKFLGREMPDYQLRRKQLRQMGSGLVL